MSDQPTSLAGHRKRRDSFDRKFKTPRKRVLEQHNHRCVKCGSTNNVEVHHVNGYEDNSIENLRPLCSMCHNIAPSGSEYWTWEKEGPSGMQFATAFMIEDLGLKHQPNVEVVIALLFGTLLESYDRYKKKYKSRKVVDGIKRAVDRGVKLGRKPREVDIDEVRRLQAEGKSLREIATMVEPSLSSITRALRQSKLENMP